MSKINQIQQALKEIDQARFQKLCDAYLRKRGYDNVNPLGSVIGKDKVRVGTPDTFIPLANGNYLFAEYTTEAAGVARKFKKDLEKCFDEEKTGVPVEKIEKIVLCYNSQMNVSEVHELRGYCAENGCELDVYGIGVLSQDLAEKYPGIAKEYLNIDVDTGQILDQERFVSAYQANAYATRIDTVFLGRETDLELALNALRANPVLLIGGRPGVGKTRFVIECCRRFVKENPGYEIRYVRNLGADLFNDLRLHYREPGQYVIVVDDANRLTGLDHVLSLLQDVDAEHQYKVVCTVRDYATDKVRRIVTVYKDPIEIEIVPFTDDEIRQLVEAEHGIRNGEYLNRIVDLSQGNPRIAMMAASIATESNSLAGISDVSALYDRYFESITRDVENANDPEFWRVAGVITFFRNVDRTNAEQMELISSVFGLDVDMFWRNARRLHELEIVDIYEDESMVRVADQILATYLFYRAVFVDRVLSLAPILIGLFPRFRQRLMDAINPVYSAFDEKKVEAVLKPSVLAAWEHFERDENRDGLWELMEAFWWLAETKVLKTIRDIVDGTEAQVQDFGDIEWKATSGIPRKTPVSVLQQLRWSSSPENALKIMLAYAAKVPDNYRYLIHILTTDYVFRYDSSRNGYQHERIVLDTVWEQWRNSGRLEVGRLFIAIAAEFVKTHHTSMSSDSYKRDTVNFVNFDLAPTEDLRDLRQTMLRRLLELYQYSELREAVRDLLYSYPRMGYQNDGREIGTWDMEVLAPFIRQHLNPNSISDILLVQSIFEHWQKRGVSYDSALDTMFTSETYQLAMLLENDRDELLELGYEEYQKKRREEIRNRFGTYSAEQYVDLLEKFNDILQGLPSAERDYPYKESVDDVVLDLLERDADMFVSVMNRYLADGDKLDLGRRKIVREMVATLGAERSLEIINRVPLSKRDVWLGQYYESLPSESVTEEIVTELVALYQTSDAQSLPYQFDYLKRYLAIDPNVGTRIVRTLLDRGADDKRFLRLISGLFNVLRRSEPDMEVIQSLELPILQQAYLQVGDVYDHIDLHGIVFDFILNQNFDFLRAYIQHRYQIHWSHKWKEDREYSFLWRRPDHKTLLEGAIDLTVTLDGESEFGFAGIVSRLLLLPSEAIKREPELRDRMVVALEELIASRHMDREFIQTLFKAASELDQDIRRRLIAQFLRYNHKVDDFKSLALESSHWSSNGSWVPVWTKRKEYYQSLLPMLVSLELLDHREIIEGIITSLEGMIEKEKRKDFLRD